MKARVHQVLATLGYGDAIGHEVLGIQRVLRRAGFESDIFVQTADPRLEEVHASAIEAYGPPGDLPPGAVLHFHGTDPAVGRLVKYAMVHPHGHPAR